MEYKYFYTHDVCSVMERRPQAILKPVEGNWEMVSHNFKLLPCGGQVLHIFLWRRPLGE